MSKTSLLAAICASLSLASVSHAALFSAVSATSNMGAYSGSNLANTISGVGLSSLSLGATHSATQPGNSWAGDSVTGSIVFNFGSSYALGGFAFWNQNAGGPGAAGITGLNRVLISISTDNVTFNPLAGAPVSFALESGSTSSAQQFSFPAVIASFVKIDVLSNHGDTARSGFAEIQFDGARVPDSGTSVVLLGLALTGLFAVRRRVGQA